MQLYPHQQKAVERLKNGSVLVGGVGSGKSLTSLYYWYCKVCGGQFNPWKERKEKIPLYIITTAKKRNDGDWDDELFPFCVEKDEYVVDSWNNVSKYTDVKNSFFIFDEQRISNYGTWSKSMIKITRSNRWVLLSATPGDTWMDYLTLFIAHRFVRNKSEFTSKYCVYSRFSKFPKVERYLEEWQLKRWRSQILVIMKDQRKTHQVHKNVFCNYDRILYNDALKRRRNVFTDESAQDMGEMCRVLRRIVNESDDKINKLSDAVMKHDRIIIFYNFNYELEMIRNFCETWNIRYAEYNGHKHEPIPKTKKWLYLVQYGNSEGWNCVKTDYMIFMSNSYSYKAMIQAAGRIDRINTPYNVLYYDHFITNSSIDKAICDALDRKKNFNERDFKEVEM